MFEIESSQTFCFEIKKSKFISCIFSISSKEDVKNILSNIKKEHKKATHICFGYRLIDDFASSDDGEPTGSASKPIINIIKYFCLINVIIIVIRYFGDIKLGLGGLFQAYSKGAKEVALLCHLKEKINKSKIFIQLDYQDYPKIKSLLKKYECAFLQSQFLENVILQEEISQDKIDDLTKMVNEINSKTIIYQTL